jgi:hypothetical protein
MMCGTPGWVHPRETPRGTRWYHRCGPDGRGATFAEPRQDQPLFGR